MSVLEGLTYILIFIICFNLFAIINHCFKIIFDSEEYFEPDLSLGGAWDESEYVEKLTNL